MKSHLILRLHRIILIAALFLAASCKEDDTSVQLKAPQTLTAIPSETSLLIEWGGVDEAAAYELEARSDDYAFSTRVEDTRYELTGLEAYTEYKFLPQLTARIGQFKTMYTIENPMSPCYVELINCYSQSVNYLAGINGSDPLYGSSSGRDMGLLIYGDLFGKLVNYNFALMNGQGINLKDKNNQKDIVGNLMVNPLDWLSVGGSFVKGKGCAVATSSLNPDIQTGDNYTRNRWSAGAVIKTKPVDVRTEYLAGKDGHVKSDGYYVTASAHVFPKFDVIASYDYFNKSKVLDDKQTNYVVGLQYWFYPKCRVQAQYTYCNRHIGDNSNLLQAQLQVRF